MSGTGATDVSGIGSMVVDEIHRVPRIVGPDEKVLLEPTGDAAVTRYVGGVALNHLAWARVLGLETAIFGKQADDPEGQLLRDAMRRLGIRAELDLSGSHSSVARIYVDASGSRSIYMLRGATAELDPDEVERRHGELIGASRWVTCEVSQVPLRVVVRVLEIARRAGTRSVLDLDVPLRDAVPALGEESELRTALSLADVIKTSRASLAGLIEADTSEALARSLAEKFGAERVALTDGAAGAVLWTASRVARVPAAAVQVSDSTGAGDAFLGGLVAGMCWDLGLDDQARLASACGAACCERLGAFPEPVDEVRARVRELFAQLAGDPARLPLATSPSATPRGDLERFLEIAPRELSAAASHLDRGALRAAGELIRSAEGAGGRVHVSGIGKSEYVAKYAAALLSSTGTPAVFLHGTEVTHGSVGQLRPGDVVIALSNSGTTLELLRAVDAARSFGARVVAVTGDEHSPLAERAELVIAVGVQAEGGPLDLAPRASILAQALALQALSVELQSGRGFTRSDYHRRHPAGALGTRSS